MKKSILLVIAFLRNLKLDSDMKNAKVRIISIIGQTVFEKQNLSGTDFNFEVSNLNQGIYILQLSYEKGNINSKFVKQ